MTVHLEGPVASGEFCLFFFFSSSCYTYLVLVCHGTAPGSRLLPYFGINLCPLSLRLFSYLLPLMMFLPGRGPETQQSDHVVANLVVANLVAASRQRSDTDSCEFRKVSADIRWKISFAWLDPFGLRNPTHDRWAGSTPDSPQQASMDSFKLARLRPVSGCRSAVPGRLLTAHIRSGSMFTFMLMEPAWLSGVLTTPYSAAQFHSSFPLPNSRGQMALESRDQSTPHLSWLSLWRSSQHRELCS
jgi:hypothetical protein